MRRYAFLTLSLLCLALLAACGGNNQSESGLIVATAPAPPAPPATSAPATQAAKPAQTTAPAPPAAATTDAPTSVPTDEPVLAAQVEPTPLTELNIQLREIASGFQRPLYATHAGDGSGRLFVVEKPGRIILLRDRQTAATPFLDITDRVGSQASEQGLLSVAFHPSFAENGLLYVNYTNLQGNTVVSRFQAEGDIADPGSEAVLLTIDQPYANHNGGLAKFGPDGYLYIGMGDGGAAGDPQGHGQNLDSLLGKMLRIDVDGGEPYAIPPNNPWADNNGGRAEIWSYGLRNPWRFSFDRTTGDMYIADVGQNQYEEISFQPAESSGGENYGWVFAEGTNCFSSGCDLSQYTNPIAEYDHDFGCSVTGGYVYRGAAFPRMQGAYIFGDYCSGRMWALRQAEAGGWEQAEVLESNLQISSFGEDEAGELYLTGYGEGTLYQVVDEG
jgi:glucose/arabinose dehydrogenase